MQNKITSLCVFILAALCSIPAHAQTPNGLNVKPVWIVVVPEKFSQAVEPLRKRRESQGFETHVVRLDQIVTGDGDRQAVGAAIKRSIQTIALDRPAYVLLTGLIQPETEKSLPTSSAWGLSGNEGRMNGVLTDHAYGFHRDGVLPTIAVGRFPARNVDELTLMIDKTIQFEERDRHWNSSSWPTRAALIVGNPGGADAVEQRLAETFVLDSIRQQFDLLNSLWQVHAIVDARTSQFYLPKSDLNPATLKMFSEAPLLTVYLGHSGPGGFWSGGDYFFARDDWPAIKSETPSGIMFSCGCFGCQSEGNDGEGYASFGMRAPNGPVAVIGAIGESYAAAGKWAADGFFGGLGADSPTRTLGDHWLATQRGIQSAEMEPMAFQLLDQVDGSGGQTSMADQRLEHLQMWTLLGDPGLQIPLLQNEIQFESSVTSDAGSKTIEIKGELPQAIANSSITIQVERLPLSKPANLIRIPRRGSETEQNEVARKNFAAANTFSLVESRTTAVEKSFSAKLELSDAATWDKVVVRVSAKSDSGILIGSRVVNLLMD